MSVRKVITVRLIYQTVLKIIVRITCVPTNFRMTTEFLNLYLANLKVFANEMDRNEQLIRLLNDSIKTLTLEVQHKLKQLFTEIITKQQMDMGPLEQNTQIKSIYFLIKQIQKIETEKRVLTRKVCDILDNYLNSFNVTSQVVGDVCDGELINIFSSIKPKVDHSVRPKVLIVDLIKKTESEDRKNDNESNLRVSHNVDKSVVDGFQNLNGVPFEDMPNSEIRNNVSDLIHRMDNLQVFTDKIFDICMEMRSR